MPPGPKLKHLFNKAKEVAEDSKERAEDVV
jgi:hypothetical protein